jgi:hypothetical protein
MALTSGTLETRLRALETREPNCIGRPARFFFMLEARGPQGTIGCVAASEPTRHGGMVRCRRTRDDTEALPSREVASGATGHVAALEPTMVWR